MIDFVRADITDQNVFDVVVNTANVHLAPGGGVAGEIHRQTDIQSISSFGAG